LTTHEALFFLISYLIGALPGGLIIRYLTGKKAAGKGEKQDIGVADVFRTEGRTAVLGALLFDVLKGALPIIYGTRYFDSPVIVICGGAAVVLGHLFPVYLKFKGGTGIASLIGMFLIYDFPTVIVFFVFFCIVLVFTKYVSAASLTGVSALFFYTLFTEIVEISIVVFILAILILVKHSKHIKRMTDGTENRLNWKKNG